MPAGLCAGKRRCACGVKVLQQMFRFLPLVLAHLHFFPSFPFSIFPSLFLGSYLSPFSHSNREEVRTVQELLQKSLVFPDVEDWPRPGS